MANQHPNPGYETNVASMESNPAFGTYTAATFARVTTQFHSGVASCEVTWPTGPKSICNVVFTGHVPGRRYHYRQWVKVPTGVPDVKLVSIFGQHGALSSVKDTWHELAIEYEATQVNHWLGVEISGSTAGQKTWMDDGFIDFVINDGTLTNRPYPLMQFQEIVNRGSLSARPYPKRISNISGTSHSPRKILTAEGWQTMQRLKWPGQ